MARATPASAPHRIHSSRQMGNGTLAEVLEEGQGLERRGQRTHARQIYEAELDRCSFTDPASIATLLRAVGGTYLQEPDNTPGENWARRALEVSLTAKDEAGRGHAINLLGILKCARGELDEAQQLLLTARESAMRSGEMKLAAMTATNLGMIATVRGDHAEALSYHESSLADARKAGLATEAMMALNNLGLLHTQMSRLVEAERSYSEALHIGRVLGDLSACSLALVNVARLKIRQGAYDGARTSTDEAIALARQIGDNSAEGEAAHIYGILERDAGDISLAEAHFHRAEAIAVDKGDLILQGETARELAVLYRLQSRNRETLQRLNQSHRIFDQLRARHELADIDDRHARLESDFLEVARRWGDSIESKDEYTQGHCVRVADLACALWTRVSPQEEASSLFWFRIGALLHDVGKLMVPAEVLNKPGKLDAEEWDLMRRHPSVGVELLADIEFPWDVRPIVESHHERWDGKGYPHGLAGEVIPLTARVLCIADVYDALTSERSYKKALSHDVAMKIMREDAGRAFDPELFAAFEVIVRRGTWRNTPAEGFQVI